MTVDSTRGRMTKSASSLLRLLSRGLGGVGGRALKKLERRGFRTLPPHTVRALIRKGMIPDAARVLAGDARGSEAMLRVDPFDLAPGISAKPANTLTIRRTLRDKNSFMRLPSREGGRVVEQIPVQGISPHGIIGDISRSSAMRHEARELIRGLKLKIRKSNGGGDLNVFGTDIGTTHNTGVLHDERVYQEGLFNRLGLRYPGKAVLGVRGDKIRLRSAYEAEIANNPLRYEYRRAKDHTYLPPFTPKDFKYDYDTVPRTRYSKLREMATARRVGYPSFGRRVLTALTRPENYLAYM